MLFATTNPVEFPMACLVLKSLLDSSYSITADPEGPFQRMERLREKMTKEAEIDVPKDGEQTVTIATGLKAASAGEGLPGDTNLNQPIIYPDEGEDGPTN